MREQDSPANTLYQLVTNEEDARACADLPDAACTELPGNFMLMLCALVLTKLGDLLVSPKIVLTWLLGAVGAPAGLTALLVPIRESGSMLPQIVIGAWVRRHRIRKTFWVLGSVGQGACVMAMAASAWWLEGVQAGWAIVAALVLFSLFRGLCSVAIKDVEGKTIPRQRRGRLSGLASTAAGIMTALLSLWLFSDGAVTSQLFYIGLLMIAALLWWNAAVLFARIEELPGESDGGVSALQVVRANISLLWQDRLFRDFVLARALLMSSALAAPFLVMLLQRDDNSSASLGALLLASSLASSLSASVWGFMADASSRQVMMRGGAIAALACALVLPVFALDMPGLWHALAVAVLYFVLSVGHAGVRIGRKTYLVNMAEGNRRTDYVSLSNTVIGILLLVTGGLLAGLASWSVTATLVVLAAVAMLGVWHASRLPEVEQASKTSGA